MCLFTSQAEGTPFVACACPSVAPASLIAGQAPHLAALRRRHHYPCHVFSQYLGASYRYWSEVLAGERMGGRVEERRDEQRRAAAAKAGGWAGWRAGGGRQQRLALGNSAGSCICDCRMLRSCGARHKYSAPGAVSCLGWAGAGGGGRGSGRGGGGGAGVPEAGSRWEKRQLVRASLP